MGFDETKELDESLKKLALEAQGHPPKSLMRGRALTKLMDKILRSGKLCRPHWGKFGDDYEDIYHEALSTLLKDISRKIDNYNPQYEVLQWVNFLLKKRFVEAIPKYIETVRDLECNQNFDNNDFDKPKVKNINYVRKIEDLSKINNCEPIAEKNPITELIEYLKLDPQDIFSNERMKKYPHVSFQLLALRKLYGYTWKEIIAEFGINSQSSASTFYERCLKKLEL